MIKHKSTVVVVVTKNPTSLMPIYIGVRSDERDLRDSQDAIRNWEAWLLELLRKHCTIIPTSPDEIGESLPFVVGFIGASCCLTWQKTPSDLDLHVQTPIWLANQQISYSERGTTTDAPWVQLDNDVTTGYGPETIHFSKAVRGRYRVAVHRYSSDGELFRSMASVSVEIAGSKTQSFDCPTEGSGTWWHVCDIDFDRNTIESVNRISTISPFELREEAKESTD